MRAIDLKNCWRNAARTFSSILSSVSTSKSKSESSAVAGGWDSDGWGIRVSVFLVSETVNATHYGLLHAGTKAKSSNGGANAQQNCYRTEMRILLKIKNKRPPAASESGHKREIPK